MGRLLDEEPRAGIPRDPVVIIVVQGKHCQAHMPQILPGVLIGLIVFGNDTADLRLPRRTVGILNGLLPEVSGFIDEGNLGERFARFEGDVIVLIGLVPIQR